MAAIHLAQLKDVADINPSLDAPLADDDDVSFLPMSAVDADNVDAVDAETRRFREVSKGYTPFRVDDVLVAKITPCFENGKIAQAKLTRGIGFGSTEFHVIRPHRSKLDARYLVHFLRQERIRKEGERKMTGSAGQRRVPEHFLANLPIPLLPLPEQRRIAEILDRADALRAKRRAALAQLDTLTQSIFLDMFGDPATILHRWPVSKLGEHLEFLTSGSRGWAKHYSARGAIFLRIQNVRWDQLSLDEVVYVTAPDTAEARRTRVETGDVLLSITADLGRTAVVPRGLGNAFVNQHLAILRTKSFVPRFLSAFLASPAGRSQVLRQNRQAVKAGLNFDDIRSFVVPFPPITSQRKFEAIAAAVEASQRAQRDALTRLDLLFASLQDRAFRGDLLTGSKELSENAHAFSR